MIERSTLEEFNYADQTVAGLLVCAGGFEDRSIAFAKKLNRARCEIERALVLQYQSQPEDNEANFGRLMSRLERLVKSQPESIAVDANTPIQSSLRIKARIEQVAQTMEDRGAIIDISGMTNLWAIDSIHACVSCGLQTSVVYTEARWYYPPKWQHQRVVRAWIDKKYEIAAKYLQSSGLGASHILPEFGGNFLPGRQTCLIVFAGYEPNRVEGLVDDYAPGALIVLYGKSPHPELQWRTQLSKDLHRELFSRWRVREGEISTLLVDDIVATLEDEFKIITGQYDVAIVPHCSKMQAVASYIFWRRHPEVQLLFTSPVRFNPDHYSRGSNRTVVYKIG